jgi:hypothetical protein
MLDTWRQTDDRMVWGLETCQNGLIHGH